MTTKKMNCEIDSNFQLFNSRGSYFSQIAGAFPVSFVPELRESNSCLSRSYHHTSVAQERKCLVQLI